MVGNFKFIVLVLLFLVACAPKPVEKVDGAMLTAVMRSSAGVGDTIKVNVKIDEAAAIYGYQLSVTYDSNVLEFVKVEQGEFLERDSETFALTPTVENGVIRNIGATRLGDVPGVNGAGVLATLSFRAIASGPAKVDFLEVTLVDVNLEVVDAHTKAGQVEVN